MRLGVVFLASAAAATVVSGAGGAASTRPRAVPFKSLWHVSGEGTGKYYGGPRTFPDGTYVIRRVGDAQFLEQNVTSAQRLAQLDRFPWGTRFLMLAVIVRPTTGYAPTIKRVTYERVSAAIEQFCVVVDVRKPKPGASVERRRTVSFHAISVPRRGFGLTPPQSTVSLDARGHILWKTSSYPLRPASCRA